MGHWLRFSACKALPGCAPSNRASPGKVPNQWWSVVLATLLLVLCHYGIYVASHVQNFLYELRCIGVSKVLWTYKIFWWKTAARRRVTGHKPLNLCNSGIVLACEFTLALINVRNCLVTFGVALVFFKRSLLSMHRLSFSPFYSLINNRQLIVAGTGKMLRHKAGQEECRLDF